MVRRNQHIVGALHLVVSMNEWLLYDLSSEYIRRCEHILFTARDYNILAPISP